MTVWLAARREAGLSQRALARKAGVAFRTVQLLEAGGHDARQSTLERLRRALNLPPSGAASWEDGAASAAARMDSGQEWRLALFDFVDAFRRAPREALVDAPPARLEPRLRALLASTVEALCAEAGLAVPWWCAGAPGLAVPWFPAEMESLKASALLESPTWFRQRNIFVLGNFLRRA